MRSPGITGRDGACPVSDAAGRVSTQTLSAGSSACVKLYVGFSLFLLGKSSELVLRYPDLVSPWSPTLEGFRSVFRRPALPLAEVAWRWSFGAAACVLLGLGFLEYLDTLPVSNLDLLLLRTRHPWLISQAFVHIFHGSSLRSVLAGVLLFSALAILWIFIASVGRAATLDTILSYIRTRAIAAQPSASQVVDTTSHTATAQSSPWRFRSMAGLHFLRATLALAACAGCVGAIILAGFVSSDTDPHPALVFFLAIAILCLVWLAWSSLSWFLAIASIFVVSKKKDTFAALASAVALCRDRFGSVMAVGTWFGVAHLVLFIVATSVVTFPLAFVRVLPVGFVLLVILLLTLGYFAIVDTLHIGRLAGYVAILEAPPVPVLAAFAPPPLIPTPASANNIQPSALSMQPETATVDQDELILSDHPQPTTNEAPLARPGFQTQMGEADKIDQRELTLGDHPLFDPDQPSPKISNQS